MTPSNGSGESLIIFIAFIVKRKIQNISVRSHFISRSVSPDEEIIPIMTDSNADQPNKPVEAHLSKLLFSRNENNAPQVHNDGMSRQNKYPKKFEAETSDYIKTKTNDLSQITTTAGAKRHHRHQHGDQKHSSLSDNNKTNSHDRAMKMSSSLFSSDTALPINLMRTISPNRPYIDGNQYHQHSSQVFIFYHPLGTYYI